MIYSYTYGTYKIRSEIAPRDIRKMPQLAFAVNHDNGNIVISHQGHGAMIRTFNLDATEYEGGWFFPKQNKIRHTSGHLGAVSKDFSDIEAAISAFLGIYWT